MELHRKLKMGMIGGGRDAFIGAVHRSAALMDGKVDFIAGTDVFAAVDTGLRQVPHYTEAGAAALCQYGYRALRHFTALPEGGKLRAGIGVPEGIGSDKAYVALCGNIHQFFFQFLSLFSHFAEAGRYDYGRFNPFSHAFTQHVGGKPFGNDYHG